MILLCTTSLKIPLHSKLNFVRSQTNHLTLYEFYHMYLSICLVVTSKQAYICTYKRTYVRTSICVYIHICTYIHNYTYKGFRCTYQANHPCPWYNYNMYVCMYVIYVTWAGVICLICKHNPSGTHDCLCYIWYVTLPGC